MFADYFLEEYGYETLIKDCGFCTYYINGNSSELFITNFYIKPEFRKSYEGKKMFSEIKEIAREKKLNFVTALVSSGVKPPERVTKILKCYLSLGFNVYETKNNQTILGMEVGK